MPPTPQAVPTKFRPTTTCIWMMSAKPCASRCCLLNECRLLKLSSPYQHRYKLPLHGLQGQGPTEATRTRRVPDLGGHAHWTIALTCARLLSPVGVATPTDHRISPLRYANYTLSVQPNISTGNVGEGSTTVSDLASLARPSGGRVASQALSVVHTICVIAPTS